LLFKRRVFKEMELTAICIWSHQCSSFSSAFSGFNRFSNRTQTSWEKDLRTDFMAADNQPQTVRSKIWVKDIEKISCRILNISITQLPWELGFCGTIMKPIKICIQRLIFIRAIPSFAVSFIPAKAVKRMPLLPGLKLKIRKFILFSV
jgi:hypothetical protein